MAAGQILRSQLPGLRLPRRRGWLSRLPVHQLDGSRLPRVGWRQHDLDLPCATTVDIARFHWQRMYSQPLVMDVRRNMSCYWLKDDHDSFEDDDWPTRPPQRVAPMTYNDMSPIFPEQVPMGPSTYRHVGWGKGLEIWFTESRRFPLSKF